MAPITTPIVTAAAAARRSRRASAHAAHRQREHAPPFSLSTNRSSPTDPAPPTHVGRSDMVGFCSASANTHVLVPLPPPGSTPADAGHRQDDHQVNAISEIIAPLWRKPPATISPWLRPRPRVRSSYARPRRLTLRPAAVQVRTAAGSVSSSASAPGSGAEDRAPASTRSASRFGDDGEIAITRRTRRRVRIDGTRPSRTCVHAFHSNTVSVITARRRCRRCQRPPRSPTGSSRCEARGARSPCTPSTFAPAEPMKSCSDLEHAGPRISSVHTPPRSASAPASEARGSLNVSFVMTQKLP